MGTFAAEHQIGQASVPVADWSSGSPDSDVYNIEGIDKIVYIVYTGANSTGDTVVTLEASATVAGTGVAIAFEVTKYETGGTTNVASTAHAFVTSAGFTTSQTAGAFYVIEVDAAVVAATGNFIRLAQAEATGGAVVGGVLFIGKHTRYKQEIQTSILS